jgi:hypothetical protein
MRVSLIAAALCGLLATIAGGVDAARYEKHAHTVTVDAAADLMVRTTRHKGCTRTARCSLPV